jgi:hypothetical protein
MKAAVYLFFGLFAYTSSLPMTLLQKSIPTKGGKLGLGDIWSNCGSPSDPLKIVKVVITPDPPHKGQSLNVVASVIFGEQVTGGNVQVTAKYGIIPILDKTYDLCALLPDIQQKCPVTPGTHNATVTETIPGAAPSGHYTGSAVATDQNGKQLACIDFDIHL